MGLEFGKNVGGFFFDEMGVGGTLEGENEPLLSRNMYLMKRTLANTMVMI